jgi:flagellar hook assembly protein FlgD
MTISYTLLKVIGPLSVSVTIFNTSGRPVQHLFEGHQPVGTHTVIWNGKGSYGENVSPGIYLYRITAKADEEEEVRSGMVSVIY